MEQNNDLHLMSLVKGLERVETKIDMMGNVREIAIEAQQSTKSAHLRLDKLESVVSRVLFWGSTSVIGALLLGAISLLFKK